METLHQKVNSCNGCNIRFRQLFLIIYLFLKNQKSPVHAQRLLDVVIAVSASLRCHQGQIIYNSANGRPVFVIKRHLHHLTYLMNGKFPGGGVARVSSLLGATSFGCKGETFEYKYFCCSNRQNMCSKKFVNLSYKLHQISFSKLGQRFTTKTSYNSWITYVCNVMEKISDNRIKTMLVY